MKRQMIASALAAAAFGPAFATAARGEDRPAAPAPATRPAAAANADGKKDQKDRPKIEVCFVLDTTGSMSGLIEGAKQKIWSIANTIIAVKDKPDIRFALIGYRDKGDDYVTRVYDLTDDLDAVFKNLTAFKAGGGGDTPESVNQALDEAVTKVGWSAKDDVTKIIFLVGDAPPHMDYKDDVKYPDSCAAAKKKGIVINTVQCGTEADTTPVWREIAGLTKGVYIPLVQEGGMVAVATPFDKDLAELNAKASATVVAWGEAGQQRAVAGKVAFATTQPASVAADRASYYAKKAEAVAAADPVPHIGISGGGGVGTGGGSGAGPVALFGTPGGGRRAAEVVGGRGDLVFDCTNGHVDLLKVPADQLPPEMQKMTPDERKAFIEKKLKEREQLRQKIADLTKQRDAYVAAERAKTAAAAKPADAFDEKVSTVVREQAEAKK